MTISRPFDELIRRLHLTEKVRLLTGASRFTLARCEPVGLGEVRLSDGPTGVRGLRFTGGRVAALLPNATLLASAWSEDTAYEAGRILAEEAAAQRIHVVLGPTINLHRSLLGGRLFESYAEDPLLTGKLAAAYVRGLQDNGIAACLKHLVANESETERTTVDSVVDDATLRELYLLPFEIAIAEADPWSVMAAYNQVNGVPATEHDQIINRIVKDEWGYRGLVMSDWFATKTTAPAANGGLDLVMPGPSGPWGEALVAAVHDGAVAESVVDDHLRRLFVLANRVGALGSPRTYPGDLPAPDSRRRKEQLTRLAAQGMTVLTNRARTLPLRRGQRVALIGRHAVDTIDMGGGSAQVNPPYQISAAEGLVALLGDAVTVTDGVDVRTRPIPARDGFLTDPDSGSPGVRFTLVAADGRILEERLGTDARTLIGFDDDLAAQVAVVRFRARINADGPVEIGALGPGSWQMHAAGRTFRYRLTLSGTMFDGILAPPTHTDLVEVTAGTALTGSVDSLPRMGLIGIVARAAPRDQDEAITAAVAAACDADVAVVVVGLTEEQETEAADKTTLCLPGAQDRLVEAVAAVSPKTVVVVNAATPVIMPWRDRVDAILWAGLPGQEGGHAIAAALLGDIEPAGRLVTTFPAEDGQAPAWSVTPTDGQVRYTEGTFIGHRGHFAGRAPAPAFWFGHGLGYTTWEYQDPRLEPGPGAPVVSVTITNTGERDGRETVQVYFQPRDADQPVRLVGWRTVPAAAGHSVRVVVPTDARLWRHWNSAAGRWDTLAAGGWLLLARGLGDIRARIDLSRTD